MKNYTVEEFQLLVAITEEHSFSSAASRLSIDNSVLSKKLNKLEEKAGTKLVHRPGRPYRLTHAGERLLTTAKKVLELTEMANRDIEAMRHQHHLTIISNPSIAIIDVAPALKILREQLDVSVKLIDGNFSEIKSAVLTGKADIGLLTENPHHDGLRFFDYRSDRLCLLCPISHDLSWRESVKLKDIGEYELIGASAARQINQFLEIKAADAKVTLKYVMEADNFDLQAHLVNQCGIPAIMLESLARQWAKAFNIRAIPISEKWATGKFFACVPDISTLSPATTSLLEILCARKKFT
ncbi:LysR family transcriptional regulator [Undibacterium squillarum]|nr:LysR family transcriptional regulator [Undibacterium squillarum]